MIVLTLAAIGFMWSCADFGQYAGVVAVDRDAGVTYEQRVQRTVRAIASQVTDLDLHAEEIRILASITANVYASNRRPVDEARAAYRMCMRSSQGRDI